MIHVSNKDTRARAEALLCAFGRQGGTVRQLAQDTGCDAHDLLYAKTEERNIEHQKGWFAYMTCSLTHNQANITPKKKGNLQFWLGVASGVQTCLKRKQETPRKF